MLLLAMLRRSCCQFCLNLWLPKCTAEAFSASTFDSGTSLMWSGRPSRLRCSSAALSSLRLARSCRRNCLLIS